MQHGPKQHVPTLQLMAATTIVIALIALAIAAAVMVLTGPLGPSARKTVYGAKAPPFVLRETASEGISFLNQGALLGFEGYLA